MIKNQNLMKVVIKRRIILNLGLDLSFNKIKICGILEKLNKTRLSKYPLIVYFIQTSLCCYYMSQNLVKMDQIFFLQLFKNTQKSPAMSAQIISRPSAASE